MPFYAELFGLRARSDQAARRAARRVAGGPADLSLPSLEQLRARPGAQRKFKVEDRKSELRDPRVARSRLARGNGAARARPGVRPRWLMVMNVTGFALMTTKPQQRI